MLSRLFGHCTVIGQSMRQSRPPRYQYHSSNQELKLPNPNKKEVPFFCIDREPKLFISLEWLN